MTLINLRLSQLQPSNDSEIALRSQVNSVSANVDSFESYANSTFVSGGYSNAVVLSESIKALESSNANSAYADSNAFIIGSEVTSSNNLLVYLDGILQHPDQYVVSGNSLTLSNTDPLPIDISVGIRHLKSSNTILSNTSVANSTVGANGTIAWDYEAKQLYVYDGHTIGGYLSNVATRAVSEVWTFQGSTSGYSSGGRGWSPGYTQLNFIQKYPYSADSSSTSVGTLTQQRFDGAGQVSSTSGYSSGGWTSPPTVTYTTIDKFPFSTDTNATSVGALTAAVYAIAGQSSDTSGYASGGISPTVTKSTVDKISFASDSDALAAFNISYFFTQSWWGAAGHSSTENGYITGGYTPNTNNASSVTLKFPFASDVDSAYALNISLARYNLSGASSDSHGYSYGGSYPYVDTIDKFTFASDANGTDIGEISSARKSTTATSSTTSGYVTGGGYGASVVDTIEKNLFSSDAPTTDVAELSQSAQGVEGAMGQQV